MLTNGKTSTRNGSVINGNTRYNSGGYTLYNQSVGNGAKSSKDVGIPQNEQRQSTINENRQFIESKSQDNTRELENSSFLILIKLY